MIHTICSCSYCCCGCNCGKFFGSFLYLIVGQVLLVTVLGPQVLAGTGLTLQVSMIMMVVGVAIVF
jgi:hypothetical protein